MPAEDLFSAVRWELCPMSIARHAADMKCTEGDGV